MKKKKKEAEESRQQNTQQKAPKPVAEKPEIPNILREILGLPKEEPKIPPSNKRGRDCN